MAVSGAWVWVCVSTHIYWIDFADWYPPMSFSVMKFFWHNHYHIHICTHGRATADYIKCLYFSLTCIGSFSFGIHRSSLSQHYFSFVLCFHFHFRRVHFFRSRSMHLCASAHSLRTQHIWYEFCVCNIVCLLKDEKEKYMNVFFYCAAHLYLLHLYTDKRRPVTEIYMYVYVYVSIVCALVPAYV